MRTQSVRIILTSFLLIIIFCDSKSHYLNQSYVYLQVYDQGINGRVELRKSDLIRIPGLYIPESIGIEVIRDHIDVIQKYILRNLSFNSRFGTHDLVFTGVDTLSLGARDYLVMLQFSLNNIDPRPDTLNIKNTVFTQELPDHQSWIIIEHFWEAGILNNELLPSLIFYPGDIAAKKLSLPDASIMKGFTAMINMGVHHIWTGRDHVLFLIALLLPSAIVFSKSKQREKRVIFGFSTEVNHTLKGVGPSMVKYWK